MTARPAAPPVRLRVRAPLGDAELNALFDGSWPAHQHTDFGVRLERSLLRVAAFRQEELVGYVNVLGDGGVHAFVLDTTVHPCVRRQGIGVRLVRRAADEARAAGARWLHVDHEQHPTGFYERCGFGPTAAGLRRLDRGREGVQERLSARRGRAALPALHSEGATGSPRRGADPRKPERLASRADEPWSEHQGQAYRITHGAQSSG